MHMILLSAVTDVQPTPLSIFLFIIAVPVIAFCAFVMVTMRWSLGVAGVGLGAILVMLGIASMSGMNWTTEWLWLLVPAAVLVFGLVANKTIEQ